MNRESRRLSEGCPRARARLDAWIDDELARQERDEISSHLVVCRACDDLRSRGEAIRGALRIPTPSLPPGLPVAVLGRIRGATPRDLAWQTALPSIRRLAAAAAVLFVAAAGFALLPASSGPEPAPSGLAAGAWNATSEEPSLNHEREVLLALVLPEVLR